MAHDDSAAEDTWQELLAERSARRESGFRRRARPPAPPETDIDELDRAYQELARARSEWFTLEPVAEGAEELPRCETARPGPPEALRARWFSLTPPEKAGMRQSTNPERPTSRGRHRTTADFEAPTAQVIALDAERRRRGR